MRKKIFSILLSVAMVMVMMPSMAFAETENSENVINVDPGNVQRYLDGEFGSIDGKTLILSGGNYDQIELGRATKHPGSNTDYYIGGIAEENKKTFDEFKAIKNSGTWSASAYYVRNMSNVTIKAAEGADVAVEGLVASSGHVYGNVYDYVLEKAYESGSAYYLSQNLQNITIEGITFTAKAEFSTSSADTVIDGVTFKNCTFNIGSTASGNQALRYYNENNNDKVKNLTVENCEFNNCYQGVYTNQVNGVEINNCSFDTTGHNAIAVQSSVHGAVNHKSVVITGNTFANIGDRVIRFGDVGADTQITIKNNTATNSGDSSGQVMKAQSLATGVTYDICGNSWGEGKKVANSEIADQSTVAEINGVQYTSLQAAIAAATDGQTITLLDDVTTGSTIVVDKDLTIDLNGQVVNGGTIKIQGNAENVVLKNGILIGKEVTYSDGSKEVVALTCYTGNVSVNNVDVTGRVNAYDSSTLNIDSESDVKGMVIVWGDGTFGQAGCKTPTLNVYGTLTNTDAQAISTNGTDYSQPVINIYEGANVTSTNDLAMYIPNAGSVNISGGKISGVSSAIGMKSGKLNISGGTLTATGVPVTPPAGFSNGINASGAAIQVESNDAYKLNSTTSGTVEINITGGTIESEKCYAIYEYIPDGYATETHLKKLSVSGGIINGKLGSIMTSEGAATANPKIIAVTGGTFSSNPKEYKADGYNVYKYNDSKYVVANTNPAGYVWTEKDGIYEGTRIPSTPVEKDPVSNEGTAGTDNATTNADITDKVTTSEGKTEAVVDQVIADKIVDKAVENKSTEVVVEATTAAGKSDASQVALPESTVKAIAEQTDAALTIKTDNAEVTLDKEAVSAVADQAGTTGTVKLVVETVENTAEKVVVELKLETSNGYVSDFNGGNVTVTVPVAKDMADKKVVCVYIDDNGIYHKVDGAMNEAGTHYTFTTGHFSTYAIMSEEEADAVIKDQTAAAQKAAIKKVKTTVTLSTKNVKKGIKVTVKVPVDQKADKTGIILYRSMKKGSGYAMYKKVETKSSTYIITNTKNVKGNRLTVGKRYYYKARAYKVIDGKTYYGPMSTVKYMKAK